MNEVHPTMTFRTPEERTYVLEHEGVVIVVHLCGSDQGLPSEVWEHVQVWLAHPEYLHCYTARSCSEDHPEDALGDWSTDRLLEHSLGWAQQEAISMRMLEAFPADLDVPHYDDLGALAPVLERVSKQVPCLLASIAETAAMGHLNELGHRFLGYPDEIEIAELPSPSRAS